MLYNPLTEKLIISRDVEFDETDYWRWNTEERKIEGLLFDDEDSDEVNTQDAQNDYQTPPQSPDQLTLASSPSTLGSNSSTNKLGEHHQKCKVFLVIFMMQQVPFKQNLATHCFV